MNNERQKSNGNERNYDVDEEQDEIDAKLAARAEKGKERRGTRLGQRREHEAGADRKIRRHNGDAIDRSPYPKTRNKQKKLTERLTDEPQRRTGGA